MQEPRYAESGSNITTKSIPYISQEYHLFEKNDIFRQGVKKAHIYGIFYSFGQCVVFFAYAATFAYGSQLIDTGYMKYREVFR